MTDADLPYDAHGVKGASLDELDLRRFQLEYLPVASSPEALAQNHRSEDDQLRALRLVGADGAPTVTALLTIGVEPRRWIPGAYVQFLRLDGTQLTDPVKSHRDLTGTLADQVRRVDEVVRANIRHSVTIGGALRGEATDYPEEALRQLIRNALLHRTYEGSAAPVRITWFSDRIEIQNPGGPYGQVTRETFGTPGFADYRNPTIAEALKSLGFIERFGVGIATVRQRLAANGNPPPEFTIEDAHVLVTVRPRIATAMGGL
ncbi:MAG TPA: ATP-binding protein [Kofleriaceae bacterium]|nr:ATP-binding protein [Kofleriaceae bacterium]